MRVGRGSASPSATTRDGVAVLGRGGRSREGGGGQARFGEICGVREAGGLTADDTDSGASAPTRDQLLDPAVVEAGRHALTIFGEDLGEVAPVGKGHTQRPFNDIGVNHLTSPTR